MFTLHTLVPELSVSDIEKSLQFYVNILSFTLEYQRPESKFAMLSLGDCQIMIEEVNDYWKTGELSYPFGRGINFQITVNDVDELYNSVRRHKYPIKVEIEENWYRVDAKLIGQKEFLIMDPDGYLLRFSQNLGGREYEGEPVISG